jgi:hypothetical protein
VTGGRAGQRVDDLCRACKTTRDHTIVAVGADGEILRVVCDFCRSEHNYRHGGSAEAPTARRPERARPAPSLVPDPERTSPVMPMAPQDLNSEDLELLLRRIIREETGLTPVRMGDRWIGGQIVARPGKTSAQEKVWPLDVFFNKIVMVRNRLRTLEQQVNASDLPPNEKLKLQGYITACYGSLTSFNVLFADADDHFKGTGGTD